VYTWVYFVWELELFVVGSGWRSSQRLTTLGMGQAVDSALGSAAYVASQHW